MFNESKTTQAAVRLLKQAGGTMNYMVLIKMLYLADRESLLKRGRPITWDSFVSMKYGPVLSHVHDLITEMPAPGDGEVWKTFISEPCSYAVRLLTDPGDDELAQNEMEILDSIFEQYRAFLNRPFGLADELHKTLPEVIDVEKGCAVPLSIEDILTANQDSEKDRNAIVAEINSLREISFALMK